MSADWVTLAVAILGVAGTLVSPLLSQRIAAQAKEQEFDFLRRQRQEERTEGRKLAEFEERRSMYAKLNTCARQYQQALNGYTRAMLNNAVTDDLRAQLAVAREGFRTLYSDAQMVVPNSVLDAAMTVSASLGRAYGMVKRLEAGDPRINPDVNELETIEMARECTYVTVYNQILDLRRLMREDLGVAGQ